jgi:hypothetical protein
MERVSAEVEDVSGRVNGASSDMEREATDLALE